MKVDVYRNLTKGCISIRSRERENYGRVIAHRDIVHVMDARFIVNHSGRLKVINSKCKNVHAFVRGHWNDKTYEPLDKVVEVTYNPYRYVSFVYFRGKFSMPIYSAPLVTIENGKVWAHFN